MNIRKILALFLCLMLISTLLVSCKTPSGTPEDSTGESTTVEIDLTKYSLIRAELLSKVLLDEVVDMKKDIDAATGGSIHLAEDWVRDLSEIDDEAYEILVGATNRPQSSEVLAKIEGSAFSVAIVGNKIVIIGTNDAATADGVRYFMDTYVKASQNGIITLDKGLSYTSEQYSAVELVADGKSKYNIVYSDKLDNRAGSNDRDRYDYEVLLAMNIRDRISRLTGVNPGLSTDWLKPGDDASAEFEILIGLTNRPESAQARERLGAAEWSVSIIGNKIVVTGWSEATTELAVNKFMALLDQSVTVGADGNKGISFLSSEKLTGANSEWVTDIPEYEGGSFTGCVDANFGHLEYHIADTSPAEFAAYKNKLAAAGYELYFENSAAGNLFATYTGKDQMIHTYYTAYEGAVRIITGKASGSVSLPNVTEESWEKITDSSITQMTLDYSSGNFGMCYVVTLEDGSFIVFDGGGSDGSKDHIRLYNLLKTLNKRADKKIVIAAWILTHEHWDHFMVFYNFCMKYGKTVQIEQFIVNSPSKIVKYNSSNPGNYLAGGQFDTAASMVGGIKLVKPHTGHIIKIRNVSLEVLFTQEDLFPIKLYTFNNSTMITRMSISGQTIMWLGDTETAASEIICDIYGDYLKSDMVQVSHHGYNGATIEFYRLISPLFAFWPTSANEFASQTSGSGSSGYAMVDYYVAKELGLKEIYCASPDNISISLPYLAGSNKAVKIEVSAAG